MHYLITGGAGFIGSNLIADLMKKEPTSRITTIDNFDKFYPADIKRNNIRPFSTDSNFRLLEYDISATSAAELAKLIPEPVNVIVHLAAKAGVRPSILNPVSYQEANVIGLQNLLDFAKDTGVKQFVFASSSSVYGVNDHYPWKEDEQLMPISPYAMTKLAGEMLGHVYYKLYDIRFIALRFFTVYGPGQRPDLAIHKFTRRIVHDQPIPVYGDGTTSRDYTFVSDTIAGISAAMSYKDTPYEVINLGNNYSVSLHELIEAIGKTVGKTPRIDRQPEQPGDVPKTFADISKAKRLLGYDPKIKLEEGLQRFYEWFRANETLLSQSS
ncbi:MAG TPA: GDP-mannose 4,6-dehydratase [Chitinophagaceae bacterium]|jgi:UDP-glucuronate 4-epimerase